MILLPCFTGKYIIQSTGCWEWTAALKTSGYGVVWWQGRLWPAHRLMWLAQPGNAIPPEGKWDICHTCNFKPCVNLEHLYLGSRGMNMRQAVREGRLRKKLMPRDIILIRALLRSVKPGVSAYHANTLIGNLFNVSYKLIEMIRDGKAWGEVRG